MARLRYRQIILFFVVLILPSLAIITATRTINDQASKLAFEDIERRAAQEQERAAAEIGQDMFARLEVLKYREIARAQAAIPQADTESDSAVALTGWLRGDRLVWPWNADPSGEQATAFKEDPAFAQKMHDAARV